LEKVAEQKRRVISADIIKIAEIHKDPDTATFLSQVLEKHEKKSGC